MLIAIIATLFKMDAIPLEWVLGGVLLGTIIGAVSAIRVAMTSMPEMVAIFNGFGGGASALVASAELFKYLNGKDIYLAELTKNNSDLTTTMITIVLSVIIGSLTFTGSFIAWGKLQGKISGQPITYPGQNIINLLILLGVVIAAYFFVVNPENMTAFYVILGVGLLLGVLSVIPIGGADMPVVRDFLFWMRSHAIRLPSGGRVRPIAAVGPSFPGVEPAGDRLRLPRARYCTTPGRIRNDRRCHRSPGEGWRR